MARGGLGYAPPGARVIGNLRGAPVRSRFLLFTPVDDVEKAPACAMQFVLAEKEELFDNRDHVLKAYPHVKGPKNLAIVPNITHYGIHTTARDRAHKLALDWFDKRGTPIGNADTRAPHEWGRGKQECLRHVTDLPGPSLAWPAPCGSPRARCRISARVALRESPPTWS